MLVQMVHYLEPLPFSMPNLCHNDTIKLIATTHTGYGNKRIVQEVVEIAGTFLQDTGFLHSSNQDAIDADAILYPDENDAWVIGKKYRLEGLYVLAPLFDGVPGESWYKITKVIVNRDHLLNNVIDNVQCLLKKTEALPGVS